MPQAATLVAFFSSWHSPDWIIYSAMVQKRQIKCQQNHLPIIRWIQIIYISRS